MCHIPEDLNPQQHQWQNLKPESKSQYHKLKQLFKIYFTTDYLSVAQFRTQMQSVEMLLYVGWNNL
jgi:hypothetical protein